MKEQDSDSEEEKRFHGAIRNYSFDDDESVFSCGFGRRNDESIGIYIQ